MSGRLPHNLKDCVANFFLLLLYMSVVAEDLPFGTRLEMSSSVLCYSIVIMPICVGLQVDLVCNAVSKYKG